MRYRHPNTVRLALTTGHVAFVGPEWVELPDIFQQAAVLAGCEIEQNIIPPTPVVKPKASPQAVVNVDDESVIRRALETMLGREEEGDFTSTGLPSIKALEKVAGIQVSKSEVYRIFRSMTAEAEAGQDEGAEQAE